MIPTLLIIVFSILILLALGFLVFLIASNRRVGYTRGKKVKATSSSQFSIDRAQNLYNPYTADQKETNDSPVIIGELPEDIKTRLWDNLSAMYSKPHLHYNDMSEIGGVMSFVMTIEGEQYWQLVSKRKFVEAEKLMSNEA